MDDKLDPVHLLETIARVARADREGEGEEAGGQDDGQTRGQVGEQSAVQNAVQALAVLVHAIMTLLEFRLQGGGAGNRLPRSWNQDDETLSFAYTHDRSSLRYLVKILHLGERTMVVASAVVAGGGARPVQFDVETTDYTSTTFWPWPRAGKVDDRRGAARDESLVNGYIGPSRMRDFTAIVKNKIIAALMPDLFAKEGLTPANDSQTSGSSSRPRPDSSSSPRPTYPDDDDPYSRPGRRGPLSTGPFQPPRRGPFSIGDRDLDPLGGMAPFPGYGGLGRRDPTDPFGMGSGRGGMYPTPDHPIFRPPGGGGGRRPGPDYGFGDDDYTLPRGAVPPGARYDPIGPGPRPSWLGRSEGEARHGVNRNPERGPIGWGDDGQLGGRDFSGSSSSGGRQPGVGRQGAEEDGLDFSTGRNSGPALPPPPSGYSDMFS